MHVAFHASLCYTDVVGQIFYGIQPQCPVSGRATVRGLFCNQEKRDQLRVCFTNLIAHRIQPPIACGTVTLHFWPVIDRHSRQPVDDLFVIGMLCTCYILIEYTVLGIIIEEPKLGWFTICSGAYVKTKIFFNTT